MTSDEWAYGMAAAIAKSTAMNPDKQPGKGARIVDLVCPTCGERVAAVLDDKDDPELVTWHPTVAVRADTTGEPLYTVLQGEVPAPDAVVGLQCLKHGPGEATGAEIRSTIDEYRATGRRTRLRFTPDAAQR